MRRVRVVAVRLVVRDVRAVRGLVRVHCCRVRVADELARLVARAVARRLDGRVVRLAVLVVAWACASSASPPAGTSRNLSRPQKVIATRRVM